MSTQDPDSDIEEMEDGMDMFGNREDGSNQYIPTTNAGEEAYTIEEETKYGGSEGNIVISGHMMLNQCGSLLTRKIMN